jgi:hypothetical protein
MQVIVNYKLFRSVAHSEPGTPVASVALGRRNLKSADCGSLRNGFRVSGRLNEIS